MTLTRRLLPLLAVAALAATAPPAAGAPSIFRDCEDGRLDGDYTPSEIRAARQNIPTDVDEYTDCRDVLTAALSASLDDSSADPDPGSGSGAGAGTGSGAGGASGGAGERAEASGAGAGAQPDPPARGQAAPELLVPGNPEERAALRDARTGDAATVPAEDEGLVGVASVSDTGQDIPAPLIVVLALLGTLAAVAAVPAVRTRGRRRLHRG